MDARKISAIAASVLLVGSLGFAGIAFASGSGAGDEANEVERAVPADYTAAITADEAKEIAKGEVSATVTEVELENEGEVLYEVEFDDGHEVGVDPQTGEVTFVVQGDAD